MTQKLDLAVSNLRARSVPHECMQALVDLLMKIGLGGNWTEDDPKVDVNCMADYTERMHNGNMAPCLSALCKLVCSLAASFTAQASLLARKRRLANCRTI